MKIILFLIAFFLSIFLFQLSEINNVAHSAESLVPPPQMEITYSDREYGYYLKNAQDVYIYHHVALPPNEVKRRGVIVYVHGYGGDSINAVGRTVRDAVTPLGFVFAALDQEGFGRSGGDRSHLIKYEHRVIDYHLMIQRLKVEYPDLPLVIVSASMGGITTNGIAVDYGKDVDGYVFIGPAFVTFESAAKRQAAILLKELIPRFRTSIGIDYDKSSRNPNYQQYVEDYEFKIKSITVNSGGEFFEYREKVFTRFNEIQKPVLFLHGDDDYTAKPEGSLQAYDQLSKNEDKTLKIYPGVKHDWVYDPDSDLIFGDLVDWVTARF